MEDNSVQDDESGNAEAGNEGEEHNSEEKHYSRTRAVVTDPDVGQHIDLKG